MTTRIKGYPFEVLIEGNPQSVVLADQIKSVDWKARSAEQKGSVPEVVLAEVRAKAISLVRG